MHCTVTTILTALLGIASAQQVHVVSVSTTNGSLLFSPDNVAANPGDMLQFQFRAGNHSVVQSNFDNPCEPISNHVAGKTAIFSGYMPVAASKAQGLLPTYTVQVQDKTPMWFYCSQGKHCQAGMVMVVNENTAANASRSLAAFKTLAKAAPQSLTPAANGSATTSGSSSSSGSGSGTTTGGGSASSSAAAAPGSTSGANTVAFSNLVGYLGAAAAVFFML